MGLRGAVGDLFRGNRADAAVVGAFCASRLGGDWGVAFGTLPSGVDTAAILDRARVRLG